MKDLSQNLTKRIMRRVYAIWFIKRIGPAMFLEVPLLIAVAFYIAAKEFFWAKILENFATALQSSAGVSGSVHFVSSALYNAPVLPMVIIGFSAGFAVVLAYRTFRNLKGLTLVEI